MASMLRKATTATAVLVVAAFALVWASASGTLGGFTAASLKNQTDTVQTGSLSFSHSQGPCSGSAAASPVSCTSSVLPSSSSGSLTDTITNTGTVSPTAAQARLVGCAPVDLADTGTTKANGVMLPRTGTTFDSAATDGPSGTTGYLTFAGKGYASSITQTTEPTNVAISGLGTTVYYNLGIWFRTTSTSPGGALFGFGSDPTDTAATNNRMLYLNGAGKISFVTTSGNETGVGTAAGVTTGYNDGSWHFADVLFSVGSSPLVGYSWNVYVYVDNKFVNSTSMVNSRLPSIPGYWHVGWSPLGAAGVTGASGVPNYFTGQLADFSVNDTASTSSTKLTPATSLTPGSSTDYWAMNDSGGSLSGTTLGGTLPSGTTLPTASVPCNDVTVNWTTSTPSATVASGLTLTKLVANGYTSVNSGPAVGAAQTSTIALARTNTNDSYATGLILYAPVQFDFVRGSWDDLFTYAAPAAGASAGSTIVVSAS
ncbi:MAG: hypothetical protein INR67_20715 [Jatrophihabitans endophyticus]|nr:hypothetical protein [Jatrophihabitans endophyticus]